MDFLLAKAGFRYLRLVDWYTVSPLCGGHPGDGYPTPRSIEIQGKYWWLGPHQ